jgi:hypothetical protein
LLWEGEARAKRMLKGTVMKNWKPTQVVIRTMVGFRFGFVVIVD